MPRNISPMSSGGSPARVRLRAARRRSRLKPSVMRPFAPLEWEASALRRTRPPRQVDHAEVGCRRARRPARHEVRHAE
eukprot:496503-Pleurochrysis_carterae.AAC.1